MIEHLGMWLFIVCVLLLLVAFSYGLHTRPVRPATANKNGDLVLNAAAEEDTTAAIALWARIGVTTVLLAAALFVILSKEYQADEQKWAFGVVGTIIGYWLKG